MNQKNNQVDLSIIIASYGRGEVLCQLLEDLFVQTFSPLEILVIHQKPDPVDPSTARLRQWNEQGWIILKECEFANAQRARNQGIQLARGEILLFLDDDIRAPRQLVERHWNNYHDGADWDGVVGQVLEMGQKPTAVLPRRYRWPHYGWQHFPMNFAIRQCDIQNWPSTNSSIRRDMAVRIGGFDEQYDLTWLDDSDFSCRLRHHGARLTFDPTASITHLIYQKGGRRIHTGEMLRMRDTGWAIHFYFWKKNGTLWRARYPLGWCLRYQVFRKAVLLRPHWLIINLIHLLRGYQMACRRLREGPKYLKVI